MYLLIDVSICLSPSETRKIDIYENCHNNMSCLHIDREEISIIEYVCQQETKNFILIIHLSKVLGGDNNNLLSS